MNARATLRGFTLIELMVVVTIIGIMSAFAVPSYQTYVVRARASEGLTFVSPYKVRLAEQLILNGAAPAADEDYYTASGQVVVSRVKWSVERRAIEVWFGPAAGPKLDGTILWLIPNMESGSVRWTCRGHSGDGGASWRLEPRYLPSACRQ